MPNQKVSEREKNVNWPRSDIVLTFIWLWVVFWSFFTFLRLCFWLFLTVSSCFLILSFVWLWDFFDLCVTFSFWTFLCLFFFWMFRVNIPILTLFLTVFWLLLLFQLTFFWLWLFHLTFCWYFFDIFFISRDPGLTIKNLLRGLGTAEVRRTETPFPSVWKMVYPHRHT